ncbi:DUF3558 domain-containing protein [Amycolatopsis sp. NPDC101161]|uniref:DUF3558 domain-containing protein n=1 Tax=Amycolatopsis sp. NPDC101161 TaxID=3363940 RepID=UPI0038047C0A
MSLGSPARASVLSGALVVACALAAGCTSETGGTANAVTPDSSPGTSSSAAGPTGSVPKVTTPLDVTKYENDTCKLVPDDELTRLKFTDPGEPRPRDSNPENLSGPSCGWKIRGEGLSLLVILGTGNRDAGAGGLAGIKAAYERPNGPYKFFEPAPDVEGYPAVYFDIRDRRAIGNCSMAIGVADDLAVSVFSEGYEGQQDSCDAAQGAAAAIVKTLKGA